MKYLMTLMMAAFLMASATAQETKGEMTQLKTRAEVITKQMTQQLGLNAEQAQAVQVINVKYADKALGIASAKATEEKAGDPETLKEMNAALKDVLTPEQYEQWIKSHVGGTTNTTPDGRKINAVQEVK